MILIASSLLIFPSRTLAVNDPRSAGMLSNALVSFFVTSGASSFLFSLEGEEQARADKRTRAKYFFMRNKDTGSNVLIQTGFCKEMLNFWSDAVCTMVAGRSRCQAHYKVICRASGLPAEVPFARRQGWFALPVFHCTDPVFWRLSRTERTVIGFMLNQEGNWYA